MTVLNDCAQVIREGAPCHLYIDMECPKELNPLVNMDTCVDNLLDSVDCLLKYVCLGFSCIVAEQRKSLHRPFTSQWQERCSMAAHLQNATSSA